MSPRSSILIVFICILVAIIGGVGGYFIGLRHEPSTPLSEETAVSAHPTVEITPTPTHEPSPTSAPAAEELYMPLYKPILAICDDPWDYTPEKESRAHSECADFKQSGTITKKFIDGITNTEKIIGSNETTPPEQKSTSASQIKDIYKELSDRKYYAWLSDIHPPIAGGRTKTIKVYKGMQNTFQVTTFEWGDPNSKEAYDLQQIFDSLKKLTLDIH